MRVNSLKQHRKKNLKLTGADIAAGLGMSQGRISCFECGVSIPREHLQDVAHAYCVPLRVLLALHRGEEIEIANYPVSGRDYWCFSDQPGGTVDGNVSAAGDGGGVPGSAGVDGAVPGPDAGSGGQLRGAAPVARVGGISRAPAAAQALAAVAESAPA